MDEGDAVPAGVLGRLQDDLAAVDGDVAAFGLIDAAEHIHQVDFPAPLTPTRPTISPPWASKETSSSA